MDFRCCICKKSVSPKFFWKLAKVLRYPHVICPSCSINNKKSGCRITFGYWCIELDIIVNEIIRPKVVSEKKPKHKQAKFNW